MKLIAFMVAGVIITVATFKFLMFCRETWQRIRLWWACRQLFKLMDQLIELTNENRRIEAENKAIEERIKAINDSQNKMPKV